jgi:1,4-dihydroxy-2-naphthoate octaprenyltransferase
VGLAIWRGVAAPVPALAALVGALLIQIATNLANDYFDHERGADTEERVGPVRVTAAGWVAPRTVKRAMLLTLAAALGVGVYLAFVGGWPIVVIGVVSLVLAVAYTGGPFPLAYHGLGDVFVFVFFGLIAVAGTYYVQALRFPAEAWWLGAGVGALSTAILVVNNLRDRETDLRAGKRTLAVRLGQRGSQLEYLFLLVFAAAVPVVGIAGFGWPPTVLAGAAAALPAWRGWSAVRDHRHPADLLPTLGVTAAALLLYSVGIAGGFVVAAPGGAP